MRIILLEIRTRSRRERVATGNRLCTPPGKGRVLSVVLAAHVVPGQAERVHVALRGMCEREAVGGRMARVVEVKRLRCVGIKPLGALSRHVNEARRIYGPPGSAAVKADRRQLDAEKLSNEARQSRDRTA